MKLDEEGDAILNVETCTEFDEFVLTTALGQAIRFRATDVRVFAGRNSIGVRGISLAKGDKVISMAILAHVEATPQERTTYLKHSTQERRSAGIDAEEVTLSGADAAEETELSQERYDELKAREQFLLTVSEKGFGKRSSSYDFRISGRGGKGIKATDVSKVDDIGPLIAAFPIEDGDQIMLVSNGGQLIRVPVQGIRIASRATKGVTIFATSDDERVVSVERISEPESEEDGAETNGEAEGDTPDENGGAS
jgi:DNA gyrase subunit A